MGYSYLLQEVYPSLGKRMASRYPPRAQIAPFPNPVLFDRLIGIFAARREKAASAAIF